MEHYRPTDDLPGQARFAAIEAFWRHPQANALGYRGNAIMAAVNAAAPFILAATPNGQESRVVDEFNPAADLARMFPDDRPAPSPASPAETAGEALLRDIFMDPAQRNAPAPASPAETAEGREALARRIEALRGYLPGGDTEYAEGFYEGIATAAATVRAASPAAVPLPEETEEIWMQATEEGWSLTDENAPEEMRLAQLSGYLRQFAREAEKP